MRRITCIIILFATISLYAFTRTSHNVKMRDNRLLSTDVYFPDSYSGEMPVILHRTPYNKNSDVDSSTIKYITDDLKYIYVTQDTRGRYESQGIDSCFWDDGWGTKQDGYDTIEWIAAQSWSNGRIGMWGASACGIVQLLAAGAHPPHLTCITPEVATYDFYNYAVFQGGEFRYSMLWDWLNGQGSMWMWEFWRSHPNYDSTWAKMDLRTRLDSVRTPGFHVGGFIDIFCDATINAMWDIQKYGGEGARGNQKLLMGWWSHCDFNQRQQGEMTLPPNGTYDYYKHIIDWWAYHLKGEQNNIMDLPLMTYYLLGDVDRYPTSPGNEWFTTDVWPPDSVVYEKWFLNGDGALLRNSFPSSQPYYKQFFYNPDNPVPTNGGRNLTRNWGFADQREQENRSDVLVYQSEVFKEPVTVIGPVKVHLFVTSNCIDTDFTAKITDVYPDGRSILLADGILMGRHYKRIDGEDFLEPGKIYEMKIDLWSIATAFDKDHRIRIAISSSNYPRFETNPNTGETFGKSTHTKIAQNTIWHGKSGNNQYYSYISLPVLKGNMGFNKNNYYSTILRPLFNASTFPNPFKDRLKVKIFASFAENQEISISVYDISGRLLMKKTSRTKAGLKQETLVLETEKLRPGRYFLKVISGKNRKVLPVIKLD
ncbi:MAG: CocE/NonD family hydrolase [Candidatus Coatesbacteria bacterium]|nr:CocE/NonD family hydrolase [Candidatus Coatesbacteria bacterium]